jgi:hypothetical protein
MGWKMLGSVSGSLRRHEASSVATRVATNLTENLSFSADTLQRSALLRAKPHRPVVMADTVPGRSLNFAPLILCEKSPSDFEAFSFSCTLKARGQHLGRINYCWASPAQPNFLSGLVRKLVIFLFIIGFALV